MSRNQPQITGNRLQAAQTVTCSSKCSVRVPADEKTSERPCLLPLLNDLTRGEVTNRAREMHIKATSECKQLISNSTKYFSATMETMQFFFVLEYSTSFLTIEERIVSQISESGACSPG